MDVVSSCHGCGISHAGPLQLNCLANELILNVLQRLPHTARQASLLELVCRRWREITMTSLRAAWTASYFLPWPTTQHHSRCSVNGNVQKHELRVPSSCGKIIDYQLVNAHGRLYLFQISELRCRSFGKIHRLWIYELHSAQASLINTLDTTCRFTLRLLRHADHLLLACSSRAQASSATTSLHSICFNRTAPHVQINLASTGRSTPGLPRTQMSSPLALFHKESVSTNTLEFVDVERGSRREITSSVPISDARMLPNCSLIALHLKNNRMAVSTREGQLYPLPCAVHTIEGAIEEWGDPLVVCKVGPRHLGFYRLAEEVNETGLEWSASDLIIYADVGPPFTRKRPMPPSL